MHALATGFDWVGFWPLWIAAAFVAFVGVVIPLLLFLVALAEKLKLRPLAPVNPERWDAIAAKSLQLVEAAQAAGFRLLGLYSDGDKGWKEGLVGLLLSEDGQTLLWVQHRPRRCKLVTAFADESWVVSTDVSGVADLSCLNDEQMLPDVAMPVLLAFHRERVVRHSQPVVPFEAEQVVDQVWQHERERVGRMVERGLARYRTAQQDTYGYTLAGAAKVMAGYVSALLAAKRQMEEAKARTAAAETALGSRTTTLPW